MAKYIVTGGAGFIGSNVVQALNDRGETDILVVDDLNHPLPERHLSRLNYAAYLDKRDLRPALLRGEFADAAAVFHLGACSSTTEKDAAYLADNNTASEVLLVGDWDAPYYAGTEKIRPSLHHIYQQIRDITVPLLKPTFIILLLYALGGIMKGQFELFYQLVGNNGTLFNATDIFDTYVYRITTTQPLSMGLGTAAGLFQSLFGLIVIVVTNVCIKHRNPEYALF